MWYGRQQANEKTDDNAETVQSAEAGNRNENAESSQDTEFGNSNGNAESSQAEESGNSNGNAENSQDTEFGNSNGNAENSRREESGNRKGNAKSSQAAKSGSNNGNNINSNTTERRNHNRNVQNGKAAESEIAELQKLWKTVATQVLMEAQVSRHSGRGEIAGSMLQNLRRLTRETCNYTEFLQKFATHREERMQTDEDEFDYVFYTYGLKLFGRVPLIEPLEYREKQLIREFIIAIDTSGSCQGEIVEKFLTKTYNILRQAESFTSRMNIHILQCDACIQEDRKIETGEELEEYIANLTLKGFGGTDFTPVFEYADQLLEKGEIGRLDGLLYFTDGYGRFPARPPGYQTVFVFVDKEEEVQVPPWAMKVYLDYENNLK